MKKNIKFLLVIIVGFMLCIPNGESPASDLGQGKLVKNGITIHIRADHQLNLTNRRSHALYLVVYQLDDPNPLLQLAQDQAGLKSLLKGSAWDKSVISAKNIIVYPDTDMTHRLDRVQGAQYVAVLAGYPIMSKERIMRVYEIPRSVKREGIFWLNKKQILLNLEISITLGPTQIIDDHIVKKPVKKYLLTSDS